MIRSEMMERMSETEFLERVALERIDPLPDEWMMWRWQMAALTGKKPDDFQVVRKTTDTQSIKSKFMALAHHTRNIG